MRKRRLLEHERFGLELQLTVLGWGEGVWDKMLSVALVLAILGALGMLGYVIATPKVGETFTEFYVLGMKGEAAHFPKELVAGKEGKVIVGIINHEHQPMVYRVEVKIDDKKDDKKR